MFCGNCWEPVGPNGKHPEGHKRCTDLIGPITAQELQFMTDIARKRWNYQVHCPHEFEPATRCARCGGPDHEHDTHTLTVIGTVLRAEDPEPPDNTWLLGDQRRVWCYQPGYVPSRTPWPEFAEKYGPFVVVPNYDRLFAD
jgi:hypothetical protein